MTITKRFFSKALASLMLAGLCLCFVTSGVRGQCPSNIDPTSVTWSGPINDSASLSCSGSCEVVVSFCYRSITDAPNPDILEIYIEGITLEGSSCDNCGFSAVMNEAKQIALNHFGGALPACSGTDRITGKLFLSSCYYLNANSLNKAYDPCGNGTSYCVETCQLCYSGGVVTATGCTFSTIGTPDCSGCPGGGIQVSCQ